MTNRDERGQVVVVVAGAFVALLGMLALLFDGANGVVLRRELQDSADAAALAGANVVQVGAPAGCSATAGGAPRTSVVNAAKASLALNAPWYDGATAVVTCPGGYQNQAVAVALAVDAPRFFGGIFGADLRVAARGAAVNGQLTEAGYAVIILNPHHPSWPNGRQGCPSVRISGEPTIVFNGTVQVNSACSGANGGAIRTDGSNASIIMNNGSTVRVVGQVNDPFSRFTPAPTQGVSPIADPLAGLPAVNVADMPVRSTSRLSITASTVLQPGVYRGGITVLGSATVLLNPGIYVMDGQGLNVGGEAKFFAVNSGVTSASNPDWASKCTAGSCGVMIYNRTGTSAAMGPINIGGGAVVKLRPYDPAAISGGGVAEYKNMLIWQDANPVPTSTYEQPAIQMHGHGENRLLGTIYAPSALVNMGGGGEATGGSPVTQRMQFISWDLRLHGSPSFTFEYQNGSFSRPTDYGLVP